MSSMLSSQGVALATAMAAVSGTVILLSFCIQKSIPNPQFPLLHNHHNHKISPPILRSCISSESRKREKKKKKNQSQKRVHFAEDVVDPIGNGEEFRRQHEIKTSNSTRTKRVDRTQTGGENRGRMPANRMALYNGILRDRGGVHRYANAYSS